MGHSDHPMPNMRVKMGSENAKYNLDTQMIEWLIRNDRDFTTFANSTVLYLLHRAV